MSLGGVLFTTPIASGRKVIYRKQGEFDILELRRVVLGNRPHPEYVGHRAYWAVKRPEGPTLLERF